MRAIPTKLRDEIADGPFMKHCIYKNCPGKPELYRVTNSLDMVI